MSHMGFLRIGSGRTQFRRLVAVLCAVAFLTVGTLHTVGCCDGPGAASAAIVSNLADDGPADSGTPNAAVHCHCFSCSGVVLPELAVSAPEAVVPAASAVLQQPLLHAHNPGLDTPPPRTIA
jgi:hypothetical protein